MLVLSDLYHLFAVPKVGPASKKLLFYIAALRQLRREDWLKLETETRREVKRLREETLQDEDVEDRIALSI